MRTQKEKGSLFRALHRRKGAFLIPNPWDVGTARLLAQLGFEALATTSAGCAFSLGLPDGKVTRLTALAHIAALAQAVDLPVSADLENGFDDRPQQVAETIRMAGAAGVVGGSIEDATGNADQPIYPLELAVERIAAAAEAAHALPFPFTLTARAENFLHGRADLEDTLRRLRAYQEAGADVLYAPGLTTKQEITAAVRAVRRPVNVLMTPKGPASSLAELARLGVKRASVGSALNRAALGAFLRAARELRDRGSFHFAEAAVPYATINQQFRKYAAGEDFEEER
ncbi:MAG TPA: isocitrate lyase/phosphoenolpyruvate mutase family protein [Acidobacteriaceae bacterium]|jgi:2-methylisocitrate lyase-like PEP mutase family enzyme|nr:isocitrate lyase/phosphoenolpyruvate mutase family protein [Acidobacteriaceae bacterium]